MSINPFDDKEAYRERINEFKIRRMHDPWKRAAYYALSQESCIAYWIEQIADSELYEERWHEIRHKGE